MSIGPIPQPDPCGPCVAAAHAPLHRAITRILHAHDPLGMHAARYPAEYAPEAMAIVLRLERVRSIAELRETIRQSFADWSDPILAGAPEKYRDVARDVWWVWRGSARAARWRGMNRPHRRRPPHSRPPQTGG